MRVLTRCSLFVTRIPSGHTVRIAALDDSGQPSCLRDGVESGLVALGTQAHAQLARGGSGITLQSGDFTGARERCSGAEDAPWRQETLGRDGECGFLPFETEEGGRAALALIEGAGIARRPLDEEARVIPPGTADFSEARCRPEETRRKLALVFDPDEHGPAPGWSSRR